MRVGGSARHARCWPAWSVALALGLASCSADSSATADGLGAAPGSWADPFADAVVSFTPGPFAGFGAQDMPDIVLGPPRGGGASGGSMHVVSLGERGEIVLRFDDIAAIDGPGPDLLIFENAFVGWPETGEVAVSDDGVDWLPFPCEATNAADGFPGCAGVAAVHAHDDKPDIDPTDPTVAGGDTFDLAAVGATTARFVRIRDTGTNDYAGNTGGFDLDAVALIHGAPVGP